MTGAGTKEKIYYSEFMDQIYIAKKIKKVVSLIRINDVDIGDESIQMEVTFYDGNGKLFFSPEYFYGRLQCTYIGDL